MREPAGRPRDSGAWGRRARGAGHRSAPSQAILIAAVKTFHSLVFFAVEACVARLIRDGLRGVADRRTAIAAGIVTTEALVYAGNRARCPLTSVAECMGAERGSVTDIYLPGWLARNLAVIHVPLIALIAWLHRRSIAHAVARARDAVGCTRCCGEAAIGYGAPPDAPQSATGESRGDETLNVSRRGKEA